ncbi:hypothetical protein FNO01nite_28080 [Flavobacterium noncentrifugens]|uniref:HEPN domain-containing protein n=1 Tax=Flavobacterium noncentrifugens TaxID=1128970 RepID=A0A1G9CS87_9FLAO|nr:hypothetical protein [Flavobacterium noncentrifugens]GEP52136.1 hypothetical protein FNO01nite_28080 [Flavobacterium noncentrifugens]SDK54581.1 hypothetical protein SAMN04487935_3636 [Flavobacterium noncentrifugens]
MENTIRIPENHPEHALLLKTVTTLLEFLPLHSVYVSTNSELTDMTIVTLFLSEYCEEELSTVYPLVARLFESLPNFSFTLFEYWWAECLWKEGSPFFMRHATVDELVYRSDPKNRIFSTKDPDIKKRLRKATAFYDNQHVEAAGFFRHVTFYSRYGKLAEAAFHLHQTLQATYFIVSWLTMGDTFTNESLAEQQKHVADFAPFFGKLFDPEKAEEWEALVQLDNSSKVVRYDHTHEFTTEAIALATEKTELMKKEAYQLFKEMIAKCKAKGNDEAKVVLYAPDNNAETTTAEPDHIDLNSDIKKFADELTKIAYFRTLMPHNCKPGIFQARLEFYSYSNLGFVISDLMKIALHTMYNDGSQNSGEVVDPSSHVASLLEILDQLLPLSEFEMLDGCHELYLKLEAKNKAQNT